MQVPAAFAAAAIDLVLLGGRAEIVAFTDPHGDVLHSIVSALAGGGDGLGHAVIGPAHPDAPRAVPAENGELTIVRHDLDCLPAFFQLVGRRFRLGGVRGRYVQPQVGASPGEAPEVDLVVR